MKQTKKPFKIHFVCRGNTYRSRLAATYMTPLLDKRFAVSSSGIVSDLAHPKTAEAYAKAVAKRHKLEITGTKTQTTDALLAGADVIVFMSKDTYDQALTRFTFDTRKVQVWDVSDVPPDLYRKYNKTKDLSLMMGEAEQAFSKIRRYCNKLQDYLTHTSWVDIYDVDNHLTGLRLPIAWATDRGLWHHGVHVVVRTHDGKFVVGKRSKSIVFSPGMLEVSLGGGVDTGETPLQAAVRETYEELGVHVSAHRFKSLFVYRVHAFHPHYNKVTRGFVYVYTVTLPMHHEPFRPQPGEVQELRLLSPWRVRQVVRTHRMVHFGRLMWRYKMYRKAIAYSLRTV